MSLLNNNKVKICKIDKQRQYCEYLYHLLLQTNVVINVLQCPLQGDGREPRIWNELQSLFSGEGVSQSEGKFKIYAESMCQCGFVWHNNFCNWRFRFKYHLRYLKMSTLSNSTCPHAVFCFIFWNIFPGNWYNNKVSLFYQLGNFSSFSLVSAKLFSTLEN